jgi:signal recognition particle subunit SRP54
MVLADLGRKLNAALSSLNRAPVVDEKVSNYIFIVTQIN